MTKQDLYNKILEYIHKPVVILSENLTVGYKPDDLHALQFARGTIFAKTENGQHFKYYIKFFDFDDYNRFSITSFGEVVTHDYTPPEDEM